jgi:hypothetical protein
MRNIFSKKRKIDFLVVRKLGLSDFIYDVIIPVPDNGQLFIIFAFLFSLLSIFCNLAMKDLLVRCLER